MLVHDRTRGNGFDLKEGRFRLDTKFFFTMLYNEDAETLAQIVQRCDKYPSPGNI